MNKTVFLSLLNHSISRTLSLSAALWFFITPHAFAQDTMGVCEGVSDVTFFDFVNTPATRIVESGTDNTPGVVYRYIQADGDNLYDVLVTVPVISNGGAPTRFDQPQVDSIGFGNPGSGSIIDNFIVTDWRWRSPGGQNGQTFVPRMDLEFNFVLTGTTTPVSLNFLATTVDNDGATSASNQVNEFVIYGGGVEFFLENPGTTMTRVGTRIDGPAAVDPGVVVNPQTSITAVYLNQTGFTWTSGHTVLRTSNRGAGTANRLGALSLACEPNVMGSVVSPVTLSSFSSNRSGNKLDIDWGTNSELFNVGFQLWGLDGVDQQWEKLNNWLVRSGSGNAVEPQSYSKRVRVPGSIDQLVSVGISSVDSDGSEHYYGPFDVGQAYGDLGSLEPIAWNDVRAELDERLANAGYVKDRVNGYRKVSADVLGAQTLSASTDSIVEFSVSAGGLHRVTSDELVVAGIDWSDALKRDIALIDAAGEPVVRYVKSGRTFGTSGEIYFYGNAPDAQAGLYTDQQSYRLVLDSNRALNAPIQAKSGVTSGFSARYTETSVAENDLQYILTSAADDPWLSAVVTSEAGKPRLYGLSVPVEADADLSQPMVLHMSLGKSSNLIGVGDEHMVRGVVLSPAGANGVLTLGSQTSNDAGLWEVDIEVPGNTPLTLDSNGHPVVGGEFSPGSGYGFSEIHIDSIGLSYARPYEAKGDDNHLEFNSPNAGELGYEVVVPDLGLPWVFASDGGNLVRLLLESAPRSTDAAGNRVRTVRFGALLGQDSALASSPLKYWVGARDQASSVTGLNHREIASQDSLLAQAQGSDYLLITHPTFLSDTLDRYSAHKQSQGYNASIINYLDVVDAYGGGQAGPEGLTAYLSALEAHGRGIDHVLLVGGSTYDHTDIQGTGAVTFIPGHYGQSNYSQFTVSDAPYVMDDDGNTFANIGRWPVRSMADLQIIVDKSILWSNTDHSSGNALLIAEHTVDGENIDFAAALDGVAKSLPVDYGQRRVHVDTIMKGDPNDPTDDIALTDALVQAKGEIINELNATPDVVLYNGHGSTRQLSNQNLFKSGDIAQVTSSGAEIWLPMSCYVTFYESTHVNTLAHQLLFRGNAVNITGAMLLSNQSENIQMGASILEGTMNQDQSIGEAVNQAKIALNNPKVDINWSLLGDPTATIDAQ